MAELIIGNVFGLVGIIVTSLCGLFTIWMQTRLNRQTQKLNERDHELAEREKVQAEKQRAMGAGIEILLYLTLKENAHKHHAQGYISIHDLNDMEETYNSYHALGGNGVGTKLFEDLKKLPNRPPQ